MHYAHAKILILILLLFGVAAFAACVPAVPYDQMPGGDLYTGANGNRMTANAALQQAQWQEQALTATAGAPIMHITETVAAMAIQQQYWTVTAQSIQETQVAAATQTASYWTPTPNATSTAAFALLNAQGTQMANQAIEDDLRLERQKAINDFQGKLPGYAFFIVVLSLAIVLMWTSRWQRYQPAKVDARGNVVPLLDIVQGSFTDIDRSPNYRGSISNDVLARMLAFWVEKKFGVPPQLPAVTAVRQDATTERDQMIDLATRGLPASASETKQQKQLAGQAMMKQLSASNLENRYKVLDGDTSDLNVINGDIITVLDQDWKEIETK